MPKASGTVQSRGRKQQTEDGKQAGPGQEMKASTLQKLQGYNDDAAAWREVSEMEEVLGRVRGVRFL